MNALKNSPHFRKLVRKIVQTLQRPTHNPAKHLTLCKKWLKGFYHELFSEHFLPYMIDSVLNARLSCKSYHWMGKRSECVLDNTLN